MSDKKSVKKTRTTTRVQLDLGPKALARLIWIQEITEAATRAEVFRNLLIEKEKQLKDHGIT